MDLSNLKPAKGSIKKTKRIARGEGSGHGGTSTRGHKGAKSRSGYSSKLGFEGGQMPLQRRLPKFGFNSPNRIEYQGINLDVIEKLADEKKVTIINPEFLMAQGLLSKSDKLKILARGAEAFKSKLEIKAHAFSKAATVAIEQNGGKVEKL